MKLLSLILAATLFVACNNAETTEQETKTDSAATASKVAAETPANNTLTEAEKADGWKLLFDGVSTKGWHVFNKRSDGHAWVVNDGAIHLDPKEFKGWQTIGGGDLVSDEEYGNFHLKLDWKLPDSANSGIILFVKEDPKYEHTWFTGCEMQVLDNNGHSDARIPKHRAGDLYDLISASPETVKKAGEWNQVEIVSKDSTLEFSLNGTKVLNTKIWDDNWRKMLKNSKFKDMKDFGTYTSGRIGLQDHGNKIWYRNIKIRTL